MKDEGYNTKEKILDVALDLFAVHGYTPVSVRDISAAVGIKESSIYAHFKNKEEILEVLLKRAEGEAQVKKESFNRALSLVSGIERGGFITAGTAYLEGYLLVEEIYKFLQVLTIEKQRNGRAAVLYHQILFAVPLEHHEKVFTYLVQKGHIPVDTPELLAAEYQSLILFVFQKYFSTFAMCTEETKEAANKELSGLLGRFFDRNFKEATV